jgi:TonB family protein
MRCRFVPDLRDVRSVTSALFAAIALPSLLGAQSSCPTVDTTPPFAWCRVERRPVPRSGNSIPSFPVSLQSAQLEGEVRLELVVNEDGEVDPASMHLLAASHDLFVDAVRKSVLAWRFEPAERDGRWVPVELAVEVDFLLPPADSIPWREITRIDSTRTGLRIRTGWESVPYDSTAASDSTAIHTIVATALRALAPMNDASGAVCLTWRRPSGTELPPAVVAALSAGSAPLRSSSSCEPTFGSMIAQQGSVMQQGAVMQQGSVTQQGAARRTRGTHGSRGGGNAYRRPLVAPRSPIDIDPLRVEISDLRPWAPDVYVFRGNLSRGINGWTYQCDARRANTSATWQTRCRRTPAH